MSSSSNNAVPVPEEEEALAWGTSPVLSLSYGMVSMKGMPLALTDAVMATPSFTALTPPMGLDFFAVVDVRGLGAAAAAAGGGSDRLLALLRDAAAGQVYSELTSHSPRFRDETSRSRDGVVGWWATTLREAFRVFHDEVAAACSSHQGEHGVDAPAAGATAIVALVAESYLVIGNCGASKAVLSRDGEVVELGSDSKHMANRTAHDELNRPLQAKIEPRTAGVVDVDVVAVGREAAHDEFLILGSAAFWDKVTPAAACEHVRRRLGRTSRVTMPWETRTTDAEASPTLLAEELAKKAVHAGSRDNVSVGLVVFRDFLTAGRRIRKPNRKFVGPEWGQ